MSSFSKPTAFITGGALVLLQIDWAIVHLALASLWWRVPAAAAIGMLAGVIAGWLRRRPVETPSNARHRERRPMTTGRKAVLWLAMFAVLYGVTERIARYIEVYAEKYKHYEYTPLYVNRLSPRLKWMIGEMLGPQRDRYYQIDRELGWSIQPGNHVGEYQSNSGGFRALRDYSIDPPPGVLRIAAFGDSFTHADDVFTNETWAARMEELDPRLEVLNFGVGGYGTDQALLRFERDGVKYNPHIALLGLIPENCYRNVNYYVPFYRRTAWPEGKPRFVWRDGALHLVPNPLPDLQSLRELLKKPAVVLPRLAANDYWARVAYYEGPLDFSPTVRLLKHYGADWRMDILDDRRFRLETWNMDSEAIQVTLGIFSRFAREARARNIEPVVVLFPDSGDFLRYRANGTKIYPPMLEWLREHGIRYVDAMEAFDKFAPDASVHDLYHGHFNATGNIIIARYLVEWLKRDPVAAPRLAVGRTRSAVVAGDLQNAGVVQGE